MGTSPLQTVSLRRKRQNGQSLYEDSRRQETAAAQKAKDDLAARLASEFLELKAEFPELSEFSAVPGSVLDMAVKGVNLTDAYLRYQHTESKKAAAAKASQEGGGQSVRRFPGRGRRRDGQPDNRRHAGRDLAALTVKT